MSASQRSRERPAQLAGEGFDHRVALLLGAALVDERDDLPVPGEDVARDMAYEDVG